MSYDPTAPDGQQVRGATADLFIVADPEVEFPTALTHGLTRVHIVDVVDERYGDVTFTRRVEAAQPRFNSRIDADGLHVALVYSTVWNHGGKPYSLKPWRVIDGRPHIPARTHFARAVAQLPEHVRALASEFVRVEDIAFDDPDWKPVADRTR